MSGKVRGVVAVDGKTARRSREDAGDIKPIHTVSAWAVESSLIPGRLCVDEKNKREKDNTRAFGHSVPGRVYCHN